MKTIKNIFITLGLFILSMLPLLLVAIVQGVNFELFGEYSMSNPTFLVLLLITVLLILLSVRIAKKLKLAPFDFSFVTRKNIIIILSGFVIARLIVHGGMYLLQMQGIEGTANDIALQEIILNSPSLLMFTIVSIAAPFMEEIAFRGGIIGLVFKNQPTIGIVVSTIIFAFMHGPTDPISFIIYASIGFICSYSYYKTGRLEVSIAIHFLNNSLASIL